ncbi:MAG: acetyl-CoA carboxylase biotin carboxylase subunit family protein [Aristaeellaceae bacterium]
MKKLLLLGGSRYLLPVIEAAHGLGIHTITCDYLPDNIAHRYSDAYVNLSIVEKEAVLAAAREMQVDGVMSFACDPGVVTAAYVAERLGLPSCGPYESVCILQDKGRFRSFLQAHGFNVPTAQAFSFVDEALRRQDMFRWPVIVKPVDSAGSKGVKRVDDPAMLPQSIRHALSFSRAGAFIIEDFIEKQGFSSDSDCFSVDGQLRFVSFSSQRFDEGAVNPYAPSGFSWPSSLSGAHQRELADELQRLLTLLGMGTSLYNVETREGADGRAYLMEVSPRGGGNRLAEMLRHAAGVDLIDAAVRAAVGLPVEVVQKGFDGCWAEVILHSVQTGVFDRLQIDDALRSNVVEEDLWIEPGTKVGGFSAANESIGTLVMRFDTQERLQGVMADIGRYVKVVLR